MTVSECSNHWTQALANGRTTDTKQFTTKSTTVTKGIEAVTLTVPFVTFVHYRFASYFFGAVEAYFLAASSNLNGNTSGTTLTSVVNLNGYLPPES